MFPLLNNDRIKIAKVLPENKNELILIDRHIAPQSNPNKVDIANLEIIISLLNERYSDTPIIILGDLNFKPTNKNFS